MIKSFTKMEPIHVDTCSRFDSSAVLWHSVFESLNSSFLSVMMLDFANKNAILRSFVHVFGSCMNMPQLVQHKISILKYAPTTFQSQSYDISQRIIEFPKHF